MIAFLQISQLRSEIEVLVNHGKKAKYFNPSKTTINLQMPLSNETNEKLIQNARTKRTSPSQHMSLTITSPIYMYNFKICALYAVYQKTKKKN